MGGKRLSDAIAQWLKGGSRTVAEAARLLRRALKIVAAIERPFFEGRPPFEWMYGRQEGGK